MDARDTIRFRLTVQYDGTAFHGWQVQPDHRTVQGDLEAAFSRLADHPVGVVGSGRTDTGVHATGQVAAADMPAGWSAERLQRSLNAVLSDDVWIQDVARASSDFHPRFDAIRRTYRYEVGLRPDARSPFHRRWCWPIGDPVDREALDRAAGTLRGTHDFEAFAKAGQPERGTRCEVLDCGWSETELGLRFTITADRYLHHMVRYLVGTMVDIGRGRRPEREMAKLIAREARLTTSPPAPPTGLFLHRVAYPGDTDELSPPSTSLSAQEPAPR